MNRLTATILAAAAAITLTACGTENDARSSSRPADDAQAAAQTPDFILTAMPDEAMGVLETKMQATEGDTVAVRGRIGGRVDPMVEGAAAFVMMDLSEPHCAENPEDKCATPWDYCCTPQNRIATLSCTVQVVDEQGRPLNVDLRDAGLAPLDEVVVVGTVAPRPNETVLVLRATGLHRVGS